MSSKRVRSAPVKGARARRRLGGGQAEAGAVAGWEALPFGLLLFVVGTLLLANAWAVVDAKMAASAGARAGAHAFVAADEPAAPAAALDAAAEALAGHGRAPEDATIAMSGVFERCARITVTVTVAVPAIALPWVQGLGGGLTARSTHAAIVDPLRSGVPGEASCVAP